MLDQNISCIHSAYDSSLACLWMLETTDELVATFGSLRELSGITSSEEL
jgi:hypothetical protein